MSRQKNGSDFEDVLDKTLYNVSEPDKEQADKLNEELNV